MDEKESGVSEKFLSALSQCRDLRFRIDFSNPREAPHGILSTTDADAFLAASILYQYWKADPEPPSSKLLSRLMAIRQQLDLDDIIERLCNGIPVDQRVIVINLDEVAQYVQTNATGVEAMIDAVRVVSRKNAYICMILTSTHTIEMANVIKGSGTYVQHYSLPLLSEDHMFMIFNSDFIVIVSVLLISIFFAQHVNTVTFDLITSGYFR